MIWIHTLQQSDGIPERFLKKQTLKNIVGGGGGGGKSMKNLPSMQRVNVFKEQ